MLDNRVANRFNESGQGLAEYVLIGALILIAGVSALALLGQSLKSGLSGMVPARPEIVAVTAPANSQVAGPGSAPSAGSGAQRPAAGQLVSPDTMQVKLSDGTTLTLSVPNDATESIMTIGANGTTKLLAQSLESLAAQLKAEGKIDEAGSDAISRLANLSHRIARVEEVVEAAMEKSDGNLQAALNTPVVFEGKTYAKVTDLTNLIKTGSQNPDGSYTFGSQTNDLFSAFSGLWDTGVMKDPKVEAIIDVYVHEIANLADGNRVVVEQMNNNYGTTDQYRAQLARYMTTIGYDNTASKLSQKTGSQVTHVDSKKICTTGGNRDTGSTCKP